MNRALLIAMLMTVGGWTSVNAASVKTYGIPLGVDVTNALADQAGSAEFAAFDLDTGNAAATQISWPISDSNQDGAVDLPPDGRSNPQGWIAASQYIRIRNVQANRPGWALQLYTDNLHASVQTTRGPRYEGHLVGQITAVNGVVSTNENNITTNGAHLIPLAWRLSTVPPVRSNNSYVYQGTSDPLLSPEVAAGGSCPGGARATAGFCGDSIHYMADYSDRSPSSTAPNKWSWWQRVPASAYKDNQMNYQCLLTADGAATHEFYRLPYSNEAAQDFYLVVSAKFRPEKVKAVYRTILYAEFVYR
jgi:hypothetical protein